MTVNSPYIARFIRATMRLGDVIQVDDTSWVVKSDSRAAAISGVTEWIVIYLGEGLFTCTCPDFLGKVIIGNDLSNVKSFFGLGFYPCKHILAVTILYGFDFPEIIVDGSVQPIIPFTFDNTFDYTFRESEELLLFTFDYTFDGTFGGGEMPFLLTFDLSFDLSFD